MRRWSVLLLLPAILPSPLYLWLEAGLPTPLWMADFRENHLIAFAPFAMLAPAYYIVLFNLWKAEQATNQIKRTHRLAEPHEIERETMLEMLLSPLFRYWAMWMMIIASGLILLGSVMYFEGVNQGVTYANQTYEQTGGWGISNILGWGIPTGLIAAFLITNRHRNLPQYVPIDKSYQDDPKTDFRDDMKARKSGGKPKDDTPPPPDDDIRNALELLGLSIPYDFDTLKRRRTELLTKTHPDVGGSAALFRQVENAYQVLKDKLEDK